MAAPAVAAVGRAIARRAAGRGAQRRGGGGGPKFILALLALVAATVVGAPLAMMLMIAPMFGGQENTAAADPPTCDPATGGATGGTSSVIADDVGGLSDEQMGNAETIVRTGQQLEVPAYGWVIALSAAMQESTLINVDHGDDAGPDSRGLFQQRAPWGSEEDRMDPASATEFFFTGGEGGQPGLLDIDGWEDMQVTEAAQSVQRSAFPDAYAQHEPLARELVSELGGQDTGGDQDDCGPPPAQCPPTDLPQEDEDLTPDALIVLRCIAQDYPEIETYHGIGERPANPDSDHPSGRAIDAMIPGWDTPAGNELGTDIAAWAVDNATEMGVKYVIWDGQIWSDERSDEGWRDYGHPSGAGDPTSAHEDHVHVSVYGDAAVLPDTGDWALPIEEGDYELTARFGESGSSWATTHTGLDFAATTGTPVMAAGGGEVTYISTDTSAWHGNMVEITHGEDGVVTVYAHLDEIAPGVVGSDVEPGTVIGYVGETGNANGAHLHLETQVDGSPRDPEAWLESYGLDP